MGMGFILGQMANFTMGSIKWIRKKGLVYINGLMVSSMKEDGITGNSMVRER